VDPYTERETRAALDGLAAELDRRASFQISPDGAEQLRALAEHLRMTPAGALDEPRTIAAELAEAYAAALLVTGYAPDASRPARRAISGAIRAVQP
jgi:hypothetical protein